jgi:hypothetical protein
VPSPTLASWPWQVSIAAKSLGGIVVEVVEVAGVEEVVETVECVESLAVT